ncbi:hypothetical protein PISMIDRAFT_681785 [Pisolithus microcarpus 441]|uniref:Uncharacterized protein n=1 Tax=Pisolithus microcarpus 441 TaxID=765257 RepID=A0A0C9Z4I9_9AGAM|nr:hypothetical protein BKA83DRAFT_681785 [Pisolithus microcarpus]KIK21069.1 hypothetical protein PISMIDRAFT_681785 [Pisolithus microcarpus 441]
MSNHLALTHTHSVLDKILRRVTCPMWPSLAYLYAACWYDVYVQYVFLPDLPFFWYWVPL